MPAVLIRHRVADFDKWLRAYQKHERVRSTAGAVGSVVGQAEGDPNEVIISIEFKDMQSAKAFMNSEELKQAMKRSGVLESDAIYYLDNITRFLN
jgi:uncharacterized protein (DUF1330 family)